MAETKDKFTRTWITENSIEIIDNSEPGVLTLRALHYRLVGLGMINSMQHYKRVIGAMIAARWEGTVDFSAFSDHDREVLGETEFEQTDIDSEVESSKSTIKYIMGRYYKNKWENQPFYPEVWIEKKALQGVFERPTKDFNVALAPCKGYPSLTFLYDAKLRFEEAINQGKMPIILYFGDYDASGEDIPRSIKENFNKFGVDVEVKRIALTEQQVIEWKLPPAPTKKTDTRAASWSGLGQVELDAVDIKILRSMCKEAIEAIFDRDLYNNLLEEQKQEKAEYIKQIQEFVNSQSNEENNDN